MDAIECILTRRSIRSYKNEPVSEEDLCKILECARYAPSGINNQEWHFSVVENKKWLNEMSKIIGEDMNRPNYNVTYGAPVLIIVSHKRGNLLYEHDGACALENIFLAANALGLGSCWINQLGDEIHYKNPSFAGLLKEAGVPEGYKVIGCAAVGYPNQKVEAKDRKENTITILR